MREEITKILAKGSLEDADIKVLVKNMHLLTQEEKVKLGFAQAPAPEVKELVVEAEVVKAPEAEKASKAKRTKKV